MPNRSEFIRQAIIEKLEREKCAWDDQEKKLG
jgi:metal-responsive CopG/Arc/MetJ family transcriptional regulator